ESLGYTIDAAKCGNVRKNGKVKEKKCFCGSSKCRLRLY
uniref:Post-SET domain-containing protein n=1 Tax=Aegilops tauschii subsp. strangulata TaxID=200361 RepID=A0A453KND3_AEGTS